MASRPLIPLYHVDPHSVLHCPACGSRNWHIGRITAECAVCEHAIPLDGIDQQPMRPRFTTSHAPAENRKVLL